MHHFENVQNDEGQIQIGQDFSTIILANVRARFDLRKALCCLCD